MPKRNQRINCEICNDSESKYACPSCSVEYCSVSCYKRHKESCTSSGPSTIPLERPAAQNISDEPLPNEDGESIAEEEALRPLTTLKWPYVPEESAFPDPLKRDDPKPLHLNQYEAIATSTTIRNILSSNPRLIEKLTEIDNLRGNDREWALQKALGVTERDIATQSRGQEQLGDDMIALRQFAEAVEAAVRGEKTDALGLNWGD